ncbi:unnamed protein product [Prorocentrum cordatum]|uniref:ubiquitinyl hydrolase 1 n=1 Tax=Prorocentrum cordatum TaxID=2364126 RepID=A0ABN9VE65_9DINO|nr:unnamed protein product [Polarella glacialis]
MERRKLPDVTTGRGRSSPPRTALGRPRPPCGEAGRHTLRDCGLTVAPATRVRYSDADRRGADGGAAAELGAALRGAASAADRSAGAACEPSKGPAACPTAPPSAVAAGRPCQAPRATPLLPERVLLDVQLEWVSLLPLLCAWTSRAFYGAALAGEQGSRGRGPSPAAEPQPQEKHRRALLPALPPVARRLLPRSNSQGRDPAEAAAAAAAAGAAARDRVGCWGSSGRADSAKRAPRSSVSAPPPAERRPGLGAERPPGPAAAGAASSGRAAPERSARFPPALPGAARPARPWRRPKSSSSPPKCRQGYPAAAGALLSRAAVAVSGRGKAWSASARTAAALGALASEAAEAAEAADGQLPVAAPEATATAGEGADLQPAAAMADGGAAAERSEESVSAAAGLGARMRRGASEDSKASDRVSWGSASAASPCPPRSPPLSPLGTGQTHMRSKRPLGLRNLGNTCFLNAALQALAHAPLLAPFFLHGLFVKDLNAANPLGTGAEVATAFAELLQRPEGLLEIRWSLSKLDASAQTWTCPAVNWDCIGTEVVELRTYVDDTKRSLLEAIAGIQSSVAALANTVNTSCSTLSRQVESRLASVEGMQKKTDTRVDQMERKIQELQTILGVMQSEAPPTPSITQSASFDRPPVSATIVARTRTNTAKQNILPALRNWLLRATLSPEDIQLEAEPVARRFQIRIKGSAQYAARKVAMALSVLRTGPQSWERFHTNDIDGVPVEIHVSADKSACQVKKELLLKQIRREVEQIHGEHRVFANKERGELSAQWKPILRVEPVQNDRPNIEWAMDHVMSLGIDRQRIEAAIEPFLQGPAPVLWSAVVSVQETGGSPTELQDFLCHLHRPVQAFHSFFPAFPRPAGGVIAFLPDFSDSHPQDIPEVTPEVLVTGRVLKITIKFANNVELRHYNIHNYGLEASERDSILAKCFQSLVESSVVEPAHYCAATDMFAAVDRTVTSLPGWALTQLAATAQATLVPNFRLLVLTESELNFAGNSEGFRDGGGFGASLVGVCVSGDFNWPTVLFKNPLRADMFNLHAWNGPRFQSALIQNLALLMRAAIETFPRWLEFYAVLKRRPAPTESAKRLLSAWCRKFVLRYNAWQHLRPSDVQAAGAFGGGGQGQGKGGSKESYAQIVSQSAAAAHVICRGCGHEWTCTDRETWLRVRRAGPALQRPKAQAQPQAKPVAAALAKQPPGAVCKHCPLVGECRGTQQDAHEVMSFLLDALHEDLNRTRSLTKPPYIERKEVAEEDVARKGEERFAAEAWRDHLVRHRSVLVDLCQGQLRSQLRCTECGLTSVTFDPFLFLSLPLPPGLTRGQKEPIEAPRALPARNASRARTAGSARAASAACARRSGCRPGSCRCSC